MKFPSRWALSALVVLSATVAQAQPDRPPAELADKARIQGARDAAVWLVIVGNLAGPADRAFRYDTWPLIDSLFVRPGKIRVAWVNLPDASSRASRIAADVAVCASAQGFFWAPHDIILLDQARWLTLKDPTEQLISLAAQKGVSAMKIEECVKSQKMRGFLERDIARARRAGVDRAPGFILDNVVLRGLRTPADFRTAIERTLAAHAAAPKRAK